MIHALPMALVCLLVLTSAGAGTEPTAEQRQRLEEMQKITNKQNFTGWKGILVYCAGADPSIEGLREICEKTYTNANFLSAAAKLDVVKAISAAELGYRSVLDDFLVLEITLNATQHGAPTAIHANVRAYVHYSKAIDTSFNAQERKGPRATTRSGDLVFWERVVTGATSGTGQDLVVPVADSIEQLLKQFFADYLNAQR